MIKIFTQNDLIRYLYHETSEKESEEISHALVSDPELHEQFNELWKSSQELNEAQLQPSSATVLNILKHVRNSSTQEKR